MKEAVCDLCNKTISSKSALCDHKKRMHSNALTVKEKNISCDQCEYKGASADALRKHKKSKHAKPSNESIPLIPSVKCSACEEVFFTREQLRQHVIDVHGRSDLKVETKVFDNNEEYELWLEEIRKNHCVDFVTRSGGGPRPRYMACSRSGVSKSRWTVDAERVASHPVRTGQECTAFLRKQDIENGKIEVQFCLEHFGHECEPAILRVSKAEKEYIANLVKEDHDVDWVLNKIQENHSDKESERLYFASRRDIQAVIRNFGLSRGQRDSNDMVSVQKWVEEEAQKDTPWNDFFGYQPAVDTSGKEFRLGIMTEEQRELVKKYSYRGVCFDATHNSTRYLYKLVTLLVYDDVGRGRPCAFYFCEEESAEQLLPFMEELKKRCGDLTPKLLMSDDTNAYWNAWRQVFDTSDTQKILCCWHVMRNWAQNAGKIKNKALQDKILNQLYLLHREPRRNEFDRMIVEIMTQLEDELDFQKYLRDWYLKSEERISEWAPYTHAGLVAHTNMATERWHRTIKKSYLHSSQNHRIDFVIHQLFQAIADMNRECEILTARKVLSNQYRIRETHKRHKLGWKAYAPHPAMIKPGLEPNTWLIQSRTVAELWYTVSRRKTCKCPIEARCRLCRVCWEEYSCECPDSVRSGISCAHIHAVVSLKEKQGNLWENRAAENDQLDIDQPPSTTANSLEMDLEQSRNNDANKRWLIRCSQNIAALKPSLVPLQNRAHYLELLERLHQLQNHQLEVQPRQTYRGRPPNAPPQRSGRDASAALVVQRRSAGNKRKNDERQEASQAKRPNRFEHMDPDDVKVCRKCLRSDDRGSNDSEVSWIECEGSCRLWFHETCYKYSGCEFCV